LRGEQPALAFGRGALRHHRRVGTASRRAHFRRQDNPDRPTRPAP
jgi:hypothetical protein